MNNSAMYGVVERLYKNKLITDKCLNVAISLGWITEEEKSLILNTQEILKMQETTV